MFREITFCVTDIKDGQLACKNPKIAWITDGAQAIACPDKKGCITIKVPDNVSGCVSGEVICEDCGKCPPKPFKICPCNTSADCDICEKCDNGLCVKLCDGECVNGDCVGCKGNEDCEGGRICVDGDCKCPSGSNFVNDRNECVSCLDNNHCDKCQVCVGGKCVGKTCDQTCDPTTGECIECINSGHCSSREDGKNCCKDKQCVCCEGYVFNLALNKCVAKPECTTDTECPKCEICVNGKCQPRTCPEGTICIDDKCVPTCDCSNPICNRNSACTRYNSTTCICVTCDGDCTDNSHCGDSCYCNNGKCTPNPCNKACSTGADCGPNCGCLNGKCVPCSSGSCATNNCTQIDGCKCIGTTCSGDPCTGPCENGSDCGENCGCSNGKCVSCDKLSCDECAVTLGCKCTNGKCLPVPKCNGNCTSSADCPLGCTCVGGKCVSCSSFSCNDCANYEDCKCIDGKCEGEQGSKDCNQTFTLEKVDCIFKASQSKTDCCACPELTVSGKLESITNSSNTVFGKPTKDFKFSFDILKGGVLLEDINQAISGKLKVTIITKYKTNGSNYSTTNFEIIDVANKSKFDTTFSLLDYGLNGDILVEGYEIKVEQISNIQLKNNCTYKIPTNPIVFTKDIFGKLTLGISLNIVLKSKDCRAPLFTWYRGTTANNISEKVKEIYASNGGDIWFDYISDCNEGFCSGFYYKVISDCGCNTETDPLRAIFCPKDLFAAYNMDKFKYTLLSCGTKFKITDMFNNCPINSKDNNCPKCPTDSNVKYILKLYTEDGLVKQEVFNFNLGAEVIGYEYTSTKPIIKVRLEHSQDSECNVEFSHTAGVDLDITINCDDNSVEVNTGIAECIVSIYSGATLISTLNTNALGKAIDRGLTSNVDYTVKTNCDSCLAEKIFRMNCCSQLNTSITGSYNIINGKLTVNALPGDALKSYSYQVDGNVLHSGSSSEIFDAVLDNGTHILLGTDSSGCTYGPTEFSVDICPNVNIVIDASYDSTIGLEKIVINSVSGGTSPYTVQVTNSSNVVVRTQSNVSILPISFIASDLPDGIYVVTVSDVNGCNNSVNINVQKGILCSTNPADINASRPYPGNTTMCSPNIQSDIFVNNSFAPYTVTVSKSPNIPQPNENFTNGTNSLSGNIVFAGVISSQDKYNVSNLTDGIYKFTVTDSRGCTDSVEIKVDCTCQNDIVFNSQGIICDNLDQDHILNITSILGGVDNTYRIRVYGEDSCGTIPIIDTTVVGNGPRSLIIPQASTLPYGQDYSIKVTSGNCTTTCILAAAPDCSGGTGGPGGGGSGCPINTSSFVITGGCTPTVTNNSAVTVSFSWTESVNTDCTGAFLGGQGPIVINSGASHTFNTFVYPHLGQKWTAVYNDLVGDPCSVSACYTGCTGGAPPCPNPVVEPILGCIKFTNYWRMTILNTNTVDVLYTINGIQQPSIIAPGGTGIFNIATGGLYTVVFKCIHDQTKVSAPSTITLNC